MQLNDVIQAKLHWATCRLQNEAILICTSHLHAIRSTIFCCSPHSPAAVSRLQSTGRPPEFTQYAVLTTDSSEYGGMEGRTIVSRILVIYFRNRSSLLRTKNWLIGVRLTSPHICLLLQRQSNRLTAVRRPRCLCRFIWFSVSLAISRHHNSKK